MRLGCLKRGTLDIIEHPWFNNYPSNSLYRQELAAPYVPNPQSQLYWALEKSKKKEEPIYIYDGDDGENDYFNF